ncbi:Bol1p [Ascoidea rubescens DSM 1968]|uniref:Bola-like protein n=1 Tax=Ascoidea rubescens DSM 1968 TaxID=1344418 RepID=A0A1D2VS33_9ASCO|nr:bola-like protein [Ascoidea rubescens DSM 1968]ODV64410.1 bola-like protein [Ascoidea rubescens DSM 1968]
MSTYTLQYSSSTPGPIEKEIVNKLIDSFNPISLTIKNDSSKHAHHAGIRGATNITESHFRIDIISKSFTGLNLPSRHRLIYKLLDDELKNKGVHALSLKIKTPDEISKNNSSSSSSSSKNSSNESIKDENI